MGIISYFYKKSFLIRYDKDPAIPYFSVGDFAGMQVEKNVFINSKGEEIHYFFYYYKDPKPNIVAIFCPPTFMAPSRIRALRLTSSTPWSAILVLNA